MPRKMIQPLTSELGDSESDRFKRFAEAVLAVPRSELAPEETLKKLEARKQRIDAKIAGVRLEMTSTKNRSPLVPKR